MEEKTEIERQLSAFEGIGEDVYDVDVLEDDNMQYYDDDYYEDDEEYEEDLPALQPVPYDPITHPPDQPWFRMPRFTVPRFTVPQIALPRLKLPAFKQPRVNLPQVRAKVQRQQEPTVAEPVTGRSRFVSVIKVSAIFFVGALAGSVFRARANNPAIALVNGEPITATEFAQSAEREAGRKALQGLIDEKLVMQFAKKHSIEPANSIVEDRYKAESEKPEFSNVLKEKNATAEEFKHDLLVAEIRREIVSKGVTVTGDEVLGFYKTNTDPHYVGALFYHPESVDIQVIITPSKDRIDAAWGALQSGTSFTDAVAKYSEDLSQRNGGVLPTIRKGSLNASRYPGLNAVLFSQLTENQSLTPRQFGGLWWIIKCNHHSIETIDDFEKVKDQCRDAVLVEKGKKQNGSALESERAEFVKASAVIVTLPKYVDLSFGIHE